MKIEVVSRVDEVKVEEIKHKTVIVIDVLRASSTIATALAHGAAEVIPVETIGQARCFHGDQYILAGERYGKKVMGFPFSNSPTEMTTAPLSGNSLILTTTNGTKAIQKCWKASYILIGSFLNGAACANMALQLKKDITILCSGSRQKFAFEDGLCAGYICSRITHKQPDVLLNDLGKALTAAYEYYKDDLTETLKTTATGQRLLAAKNEADIQFCAQKDIYPFVPMIKEESITIQFPQM